jgi:hypothetical protein
MELKYGLMMKGGIPFVSAHFPLQECPLTGKNAYATLRNDRIINSGSGAVIFRPYSVVVSCNKTIIAPSSAL